MNSPEGDAAADPTVVDVDVDGSLLEIFSMVSGAVDARVDGGLLEVDIWLVRRYDRNGEYNPNPTTRRDGLSAISALLPLRRPLLRIHTPHMQTAISARLA